MSRLVMPSAGQSTLSKLVSGSLRPAISQCAFLWSVLSSARAALSSGSCRRGGPSPPVVALLPAAPPGRGDVFTEARTLLGARRGLRPFLASSLLGWGFLGGGGGGGRRAGSIGISRVQSAGRWSGRRVR